MDFHPATRERLADLERFSSAHGKFRVIPPGQTRRMVRYTID
jgi:hypothetical protein